MDTDKQPLLGLSQKKRERDLDCNFWLVLFGDRCLYFTNKL